MALLHDFKNFKILIIIADVEMMDTQQVAPTPAQRAVEQATECAAAFAYDAVEDAKDTLKKDQEKQKDQQLIKNIKAKINFNCFITQRKPTETPKGINALYKKMTETVKNANSCSSVKMYNKFYMGKICFELSKSEKDYYKRFEIDLGKKYGQRYCKSLIAFYKLCLVFPALKYCGVGFRVFHGNIEKIRSLILADPDKDFWKRDS